MRGEREGGWGVFFGVWDGWMYGYGTGTGEIDWLCGDEMGMWMDGDVEGN